MLTTDQVLGKGRYRIISSFTQDECGGLYEAYDTVSNNNVVLKETVGSGSRVMTATQLDAVNSAFTGEAKALAEIKHNSLLSVRDYFSEIDRHYLVMESVDGFDLTRFLNPDEPPPALGDLLNWTEQLLDALNYLHTLQKPIIHREIRPACVRLTSNFRVKLLTAGISADDGVVMASAGDPADSSVLNYRPLEQLWAGLDPASQKVIANSYDDADRSDLYAPVDARSDLYSLGATIYHVLSRMLPKDALERSIELLDGKNDPLMPLSELAANVPEEVSQFVMKALELKRANRYQSAAEMRSALETTRGVLKLQKDTSSQKRVAPESLTDSENSQAQVSKQKLDDAESHRREIEAAQKRLAVESEQEQLRLAQLQNEAPAKVERHSPKFSEAQKVVPPKDEAALLEVPETPVKASADLFEWSEEELYVSEPPVRKRQDGGVPHEVNFGYSDVPRSNFKFIAAGAGALVVVLAVVGWMFMGGTPEKAVNTAPQQTQQLLPQAQEQPAVSTFAESNPTVDTTAGNPVANSSTETATQTAAVQTKQPQKKATPTPGKSPEKKKVTVDDLINDN